MKTNRSKSWLNFLSLKISVLATFVLLSFSNVFSQDVNQRITIQEKNITLKQFLKIIEEKTSIAIIYRNILVDEKNDINVSANNKPLLEVVNNVLKNKGLFAEITNKTLVIKKIEEAEKKLKPATIRVAGIVNDEQNLPIIGATVKVSNTNKGTITDINGKFEIDAPADGVLVVSYVGYSSLDVAVGGKKSLNISLSQNNQLLNEVLVVGYGTMKKSDLTGSVSSIKSEDILKTKSSNFLESMQGKMAGVQVTSQSGEPGSNIEVKIRGANSIYGGTSPLYVIDGVQVDVNTNEVATSSVATATSMSPLSNINPADIESIEVLKDASATAIFGSRGANGVIIVTTKSGKAGKNVFQYDGSFGMSQATRRMDMLNGDEYIDYQKFLDPNSAIFWIDSDNNGKVEPGIDSPRDMSEVKRFNWQDEMLRNAPTVTHNFGLSGGNKGTTYSAGLGYLDQEGIIKNNDYQRYNARVKVDFAENKISAGFNVNGSYSMQNGASSAGGGTQYNGVVQFVTLTKPIDVSDINADYMTGGKFVYPTTMIEMAQKNIDLFRVLANSYFNYQINKYLKLQIEIGGNISSSKSKEFYSKETAWGFINNGKAAIQENRSVSWFNREMLNYTRKFGKLNVNAMGGFELNYYDFENFFIGVANFPVEATGVHDISKAKTVEKYVSNKWGTNRISYLGRLNLNYADKYLLTASMRADGSDKFGEGNRYGYFPSAAFAWRANQENFLKNIDVISNLKVRTSYGVTGNERIPAYSYFARLDNTYYSYNGNLALGLSPASIANPDLKWESTVQYNGGVDFGLFKNRINFSADYFLKQTSDMLLLSPVSAQTGFSQQWKNIGKVDNYGIELMLSTHNIDTKNFKWITTINFSKTDNKVTDLGPGVNFLPVTLYGGFFQNVGRVTKGESIGTAYGFVWDGVYQLEDFTWQNNSDPTVEYDKRIFVLKPDVVRVAGAAVKPGSFKFKDLNNDKVVDDNNDRKTISRSAPKHYGGINNTFIYKNIELGIFFDWSYGNQILNEGKYLSEGTQSWMNLRKDFWNNRWTPANPTNNYGTIASKNATATLISSYYVEDASYFRLKTVNLVYNVPAKVASRLKFSDINLYINGSNLYTFTKYSGYDPEISYYNQLLTGFDRYSYPKARTVTVGVKATF